MSEFTNNLAAALRAAAPPGDLKIGLLDDGKLLLQHISGAQLLVNPLNIAQLVNGDPQRLTEEAEGAIAFLLQSASPRADDLASLRDHLVPVIRQRDWLDSARKQVGTDLLAEGLAVPFGKQLIVTFAFEYDNRREPMTDKKGFAEADFAALLVTARANQERMLAATPDKLSVVQLTPGECTFFVRSTNLQAASLILTGLPQRLATAMNREAASRIIGIIVSSDEIAFRAAAEDDVKFDVDMLRSFAARARNDFGMTENWGDDVFRIGDTWPVHIE